MPRRHHLSATQTALLSGLGGLIAACAAFALVHPVKHELGTVGCFATFFALIGAGFMLSFKAANDLKVGIAQERWSAEEIAWLRKKLSSRRRLIPSAATLILYLAGLGLSFVLISGFHTSHTIVSVWPFVIMFSFSQVEDATKPIQKRKTERTNWRNFPPLHSDHWGER